MCEDFLDVFVNVSVMALGSAVYCGGNTLPRPE